MQIVILLFVQQLFSAEGYSAFSDRDELRSTLIDWENNPGADIFGLRRAFFHNHN